MTRGSRNILKTYYSSYLLSRDANEGMCFFFAYIYNDVLSNFVSFLKSRRDAFASRGIVRSSLIALVLIYITENTRIKKKEEEDLIC